MNNEILIKFGGPNQIRVETLTEFLDKYCFLLYRINENLGHADADLIVQVSPPEEGSFKIKISPKYESQILNTVSGIVAGTLSGLIVAWSVNTNNVTYEDLEKIINSLDTKEKTEITKNVYKTYQQIDVQQTINKTFQIVANDVNVTSLELTANDKPIVEIPKSRFENLILTESDFKIEKNTDYADKMDIDEINIIIKTVHFEGHAKWAFIWKGYPIKATISDEKFLKRLSNEAFKRGDILRVKMEKRSIYNEDLATYIVDEKSYEIIEVLEHTSKKDDNMNLVFN